MLKCIKISISKILSQSNTFFAIHGKENVKKPEKKKKYGTKKKTIFVIQVQTAPCEELKKQTMKGITTLIEKNRSGEVICLYKYTTLIHNRKSILFL